MAELQQKTSEGIGQAMNAHDAKKLASFYTENAVVKIAGMPDLDGSRGDRRDVAEALRHVLELEGHGEPRVREGRRRHRRVARGRVRTRAR